MDESDQTLSPARYDDEIDLRELARVIWAGKWLIGGITICASIIAVIIALMLPNIYRAEALLAPNDRDGAGGLGSLAAQYGDLATLAGINLGSGTADKTALGLEILKSRKFLSEYVERHDILVSLMAAKGWDPKTGELKIDSNVYDISAKKWTRRVRPPQNTIPSAQEAHEQFMDILSVSQDNKSGFVTVAVQHYSPEVAKQWVEWLVEDLNNSIMRQDVSEAEQAIEYLNSQIQSTSLADLQNVFFSLIEEQTKIVMLARVSSEYMFRTIDPSVAPEHRAEPNRMLIVALGLFLGGLLGVIIVVVRNKFAAGKE